MPPCHHATMPPCHHATMPPIHPIVPTIGFREFSPAVPREILAQLQTGDRPAALADNNHPLARLLRRHCKEQQTTIPGIAKAICAGHNLNKSIRRIQQIFSGERLLPEWIAQIEAHLAIPQEETTAARDQAIAWNADRTAFQLRRDRHRTFARLGPYLRALTSDAPATASGVSADPRPQPYSNIFSIPGDPPFGEISSWMSSHANALRSGEVITGYLYHRYPEEIRFFNPEGELLNRGDAASRSHGGNSRFSINNTANSRPKNDGRDRRWIQRRGGPLEGRRGR